jgi:hypothetical protein
MLRSLLNHSEAVQCGQRCSATVRGRLVDSRTSSAAAVIRAGIRCAAPESNRVPMAPSVLVSWFEAPANNLRI